MKIIFTFVFTLATIVNVSAQSDNMENANKDSKQMLVEASCGICNFEMAGKSCELAVRIDGEVYYVDGSDIDDHGDAHDHDNGLCSVIRKAKVEGEVIEDRFKATSFELID